MATIKAVVFDCAHPAALARFWAQALDGFDVRPYDDEEIARLAGLGLTPETDPCVMVDGRGLELCFQEAGTEKTQKNRLHVDVMVSDVSAEVQRLSELGASVSEVFEDHTLMLDPEGNEFCVYAG